MHCVAAPPTANGSLFWVDGKACIVVPLKLVHLRSYLCINAFAKLGLRRGFFESMATILPRISQRYVSYGSHKRSTSVIGAA